MRPAVRRRLGLAAAVAGIAAATVVVPAIGQGGSAGAARALPALGTGDPQLEIMGAASAGEAGETWGYRLMPLDTPLGSGPLQFGASANPANPTPQLVFERVTDAQSGWTLAETPLDRAGQPYRGMTPNPLSARITPHGGGVLVGRDDAMAPGQQVVVLARDPGGRFQLLPEVPPTVALPAGGSDPAETLATDAGTGRVAVAAFDDGGRTQLFAGLLGRQAESAIARWDGATWTRENVEIPSGSLSDFTILAVDATSADNAWMLAATDPTLGDGVVLFKRTVTAGIPTWTKQDLGAPAFASAASSADGVADLGVLAGNAQPLTVTTDGVWIDGTMTASGAESDFTLYYGIAAGKVTGSWCSAVTGGGAAVCADPLPVRFGRRAGYRSFAFPGDGFGTRIVTDPLDQGGDDASNDGTYLRFQGSTFTRLPGGGGNLKASGGFASADKGWLAGPVEISDATPPARLAKWPASVRSPFAAIASGPGQAPGDMGSRALAVGAFGAVARYAPGTGWQREFLLTSTGAVSSPTLRGVAWPEPGRAYAVGDQGAMWLWRAETGLWERDPATPLDGFDANLMGVAFDPADPQRGYAVGRAGTLLAYGKTWTQETLPAGVAADADLTSIAFSGRQAMVAAGGDVLVDSGAGWQVDQGAHDLLAALPGRGFVFAVAGLPDGGAVAAGRNFVIERDGPSSPWRFSDQPLPGQTAVAAAAFRDGGRVRAVVSVVPGVQYPPSTLLPPADPDLPPPVLPPFALPGDGYVLRETASGWRDEQRAAFAGTTDDRPVKADPVLAFALDAGGAGWAVGGWSGQPDVAGRGTAATGLGSQVRQQVQTNTVYRYDPNGAPARAAATTVSPVALPAGQVTFAVGGHAACDAPCAKLAGQGLAPDVGAGAFLAAAAALAGGANGPRAVLYTGGRLPYDATSAMPRSEADRYAGVLAGSALPIYPAASGADSAGGGNAAFRAAFAGFNAPFGAGALPAGISTADVPAGAAAGPGARTHYAFDSAGAGGTVRVVVIDNSRGSLADSDPFQNPPEPQQPWLENVLADAKRRGIATIVMGSRDLNSRFVPSINVATDADAVAALLVRDGVSAYLYERPEETRIGSIPAGAAGAGAIPEFGTGTLGYRSALTNTTRAGQPDALFGDAGFLTVSLDLSKRDATTNRAPVSTKLIPLVEDLSLAAVDGTLLRRSRPALFQGLGRRPLSGDRWGPISSADNSPNPTGADPYVVVPPNQCLQANCASRATLDYTFTSSDPDIADFVAQDPNSTNLRKPLQSSDGKVVTDSRSGLLCAFNPGTTTVTVTAGGRSHATRVTVLAGSVQQPCGTRPLDPSRFPKASAPAPAPPPAPAPAPAGVAPSPSPAPPPPPAAAPTPVTAPPPPAPTLTPLPAPPVDIQVPLGIPAAAPIVPVTPPPPAGGFARPIPPGGAVARVFEEKREEEAAPEQSSAYARGDEGGHGIPTPAYYVVALAIAAGAGSVIRNRPARRDRQPALVRAAIQPTASHPRRRRRP